MLKKLGTVLFLLSAVASAQSTDSELAALRKQVEAQARDIAELRAALAELRIARVLAPAFTPAAPATPAAPTAAPPPEPAQAFAGGAGESKAGARLDGPDQAIPATVRATAPGPFRPWPIDTTAQPTALPVRVISGVTINPYAMVKLSAIHDTNNNSGDDFPSLARVVATGPESANTTGTGTAPADFRFKARSTRLGVDFVAPDPNGIFNIFGKVEFDFEGSFPISTNRNIASLRSSEASIREAWVQLNSVNHPFFIRLGQAPTLFGSTTQPTGVETTFSYGFQGNIQQRDPGAVVGTRIDLGGAWDSRILLDGGLFLASGGEAVNGLTSAYAGSSPAPGQGTIGFGQREGADADRPSSQTRMMYEFEPFKGRRLAASWIGGSAEYAERTRYFQPPFQTAGMTFATTSASKGYTAEMGLVTPIGNVLAKYYRGDDLRFYLGGLAQDIYYDGPSPLTTTGAIPAQRPVRSQGGFLQLQLPLSAWMQPRNPRLQGFSLNLMAGYDSAFSRDAIRAAARKAQEALTASFVYQYNRFWQIALEANNSELIYLTVQGGPAFNGRVGRNVRFEFANTFTF